MDSFSTLGCPEARLVLAIVPELGTYLTVRLPAHSHLLSLPPFLPYYHLFRCGSPENVQGERRPPPREKKGEGRGEAEQVCTNSLGSEAQVIWLLLSSAVVGEEPNSGDQSLMQDGWAPKRALHPLVSLMGEIGWGFFACHYQPYRNIK